MSEVSKNDLNNKKVFKYKISSSGLGGEHTIGTIPKSLSKYWLDWERNDFQSYIFSFNREEDYPNVPVKFQLNEWSEIDDIDHQNTIEFEDTNYFEIINKETKESFFVYFKDINREQVVINQKSIEKISASNEPIVFCQSWEKGEFIVECKDNEGNPTEFITNEPFDVEKIKNIKCTQWSEIILLNSFEYEQYSFEVFGGDTIGKSKSAWLTNAIPNDYLRPSTGNDLLKNIQKLAHNENLSYIIRDRLDSLLPRNNKSNIGILVEVHLFDEFYEFSNLLSIDESKKLEGISDMNELNEFFKTREINLEEISDKFISLFESFSLNCQDILGVKRKEEIEILICENKISEDLLYSANIYGSEDNLFSMEKASAIPLENFLTSIKEKCLLSNRLFRHLLLFGDDVDVQIRMQSNKKFINERNGKDFSLAIDKDIELIQCLPVINNEHLCVYQGYDHGEFETGIMTDGWCDGVYITMINSLNNTIWD